MKKHGQIIILFFFFLAGKSFSQDILITVPRLEFDGKQLLISYDIIAKKSSERFFVWVEAKKRNGDTINMRTLSGDIGEFIEPGKNKKIIWIPEADSVFLNEEIYTEVKAERYIKSFNRGSMMCLSAIFPGWGQTKISKGKPWWLIGVASYGALAGGYLTYKNYQDTYDSYTAEDDPLVRDDLFLQSQKQMNTSSALLISGAALWAANILWVAITPNSYQPLKHANVTLEQAKGPLKGATLLTLKINF